MRRAKVVSLLILAGIIVLVLSEYGFADVRIPAKPGKPDSGQTALFVYLILAFISWPVGLVLNWLLFTWFPNRTERLTLLFERSPVKCMLIGLLNLFIIVVVVGVTVEHARPLGMLLLTIAIITIFVALHGRCRATGRRILTASKLEAGTFAATTVGWSTVVFVSAIPWLGWAVFIYYIAGGLGAVTLSFFSKPTPKGGVDLDSHEL